MGRYRTFLRNLWTYSIFIRDINSTVFSAEGSLLCELMDRECRVWTRERKRILRSIRIEQFARRHNWLVLPFPSRSALISLRIANRSNSSTWLKQLWLTVQMRGGVALAMLHSSIARQVSTKLCWAPKAIYKTHTNKRCWMATSSTDVMDNRDVVEFNARVSRTISARDCVCRPDQILSEIVKRHTARYNNCTRRYIYADFMHAWKVVRIYLQ